MLHYNFPPYCVGETGFAGHTNVCDFIDPTDAAEPQRLLDEGIYARMRHPRYVSVFIGTLGWSLMSNHGTSYGVTAALVPMICLYELSVYLAAPMALLHARDHLADETENDET